MPDITMCRNDECPKKLYCYRYVAKPCNYQSYCNFVCSDDNMWEYYMRVEKSITK